MKIQTNFDFCIKYLNLIWILQLQRSLAFIDDQTNSTENEKPFMMIIAPPAPHEPFTSADQYENAFQDIKAPRTNNFNVQNQGIDWKN